MSASLGNQSFNPSHEQEPPFDADNLLTRIGALWDETATAWGERNVVLSRQEQERLHEEILKACEL